MAKFAALREDFRVHSGLRNAVALGILDIVSGGERNFLAIEHHAEFVGRKYIEGSSPVIATTGLNAY
jgi:hypothetical protein